VDQFFSPGSRFRRGGNYAETGGYMLFSLDPVARFFSNTVRLNYWPGQAMFDMSHQRLLNVGANYSFKVPLPLTALKFFSIRATPLSSA